MTQPVAPQLVVHCRMLHFGWVPADPDAVAAMVPSDLRPLANRQVFMHQYVVDDDCQTSGFDSYSVTCLGAELAQIDAPGGDGVQPADPARPDVSPVAGRARWYTHHLSSSPAVRAHAAARGVPVGVGRTTIEISGRTLVAVTEVDGVEVIRSIARVGQTGTRVVRGHMRYLGELDGRRTSGSYPYLFEPVAPFEIESLEFLAPDHPVFALRPANPLQMMWGLYSPRSSFVYPGGDGG